MRRISLGSRERDVTVRSAHKDGREVVTLRCVEADGECVVECAVQPVSGTLAEPLRPGPYRFSEREQAHAFIDEAMQALVYLGCDVS